MSPVWFDFITYPRGYKLFVLVLIISFLIVGPTINADETTSVEQEDELVFLNNGGHGLHGLRGGIMFSPEDTQGFGYSHDEVMFNLKVR